MCVGIECDGGDIVGDSVHHLLLCSSSSSSIQPRIMSIQFDNRIRFGQRMSQCQVAHVAGALGSQEEKGRHDE